MDQPITPDAGVFLGSILRYFWLVIGYVAYWVYAGSLSFLALTTITLPKAVFAILHWSGFISVQLNFQKLLVLFILIAVISSWTYKLKVLNKYSSLPKTPQLNKTFQNRVAFQDLNPALLLISKSFNDHDHFNNYLDEFLSAIRVFGFLEKPVFHELARHLQTKRLVAGDTLSLDEDKSFYIVVDGSVQVFARPVKKEDGENHLPHPPNTRSNEPVEPSLAYDNEEDSGFQLLNVVESGGTLSSLFTILSLFTEDVRLRYEDDDWNHETDPTWTNTQERSARSSTFSPSRKAFFPIDPGTARSCRTDGTSLFENSSRAHETPSGDDTLTQLPRQKNVQDEDPSATGGRSAKTSRGSTYIPPTSSRRPSANPLGLSTALESCEAWNFRNPAALLDTKSHLSPHGQSWHAPSCHVRYPTDPGAPLHAHDPHQPARMLHNLRTATERAYVQPRESTIARATADTTLAVIPAEAFKRLTSKFPNAVAHIVQVILTRLQRVTFLTSHQYLGLTKELLRTEKAFNELACYPLPPHFYEQGGMVWLRQKFSPPSRLFDEPHVHTAPSHQPEYFDLDPYHYCQPRKKHSAGDRSYKPRGGNVGVESGEDAAASVSQRDHSSGSRINPQSSSSKTSHCKPQFSCDLSAPFQMHQSANDLHEDLELRQMVMKCIAKSIGLVQHPHTRSHGSNPGSVSNLNSPSVAPFSSVSRGGFASPDPSSSGAPSRSRGARFLQRPPFRSGLGSLSYLKTLQGNGWERGDGLNETGSSISSSSVAFTEDEEEELPNEVEILFFPKDSVLVKAGQRNTGLYFVIDGFLDVFMPLEGSEPQLANIGSSHDSATVSESFKETDEWAKSSTVRSSQSQSRKRHSRLSKIDKIGDDSHRVKSHPSRLVRKPSKATATYNSTAESLDRNSAKGPAKLFSIKPGGIAGYLASISSFPSYVDIRAKTDAYVGFLPARALESIMDRRPIVLLTLAKRLITLLSPLLLHIDSALEWMAVDAGQIIFREGDQSDSLYIVIGGRLRAISEQANGGLEILAEFGQGESIGELDCITNDRRKSTLHAIRDSELVRIPMTLFNALSVRHPAITIQVSRLIASRVRKEVDAGKSISLKTRPNGQGSQVGSSMTGVGSVDSGVSDLGVTNVNLKTVAIIPNTKGVPVVEFASRLKAALEQMNSTTELLDQSVILSVLGRHAFSRLGKLKLAGWLTELEQRFRIVLYVGDTAVNAPWTQTCIRQADYIMLVCDGGSQPDIGEYERLLLTMKNTARKELVLLHPDRNVPAGSTRPWLKNRPWVHAHHHVEMAGSTPLADNHLDELLPLVAFRNLKQRVQSQISKYRLLKAKAPFESTNAMLNGDFARLGRRLCGKSIGVVLGGGGARGISHIGVIRALQERGIPIDMIGGTSIGSFIGGLYARNSDLLSTIGRAKTFSARMSTYWRLLTDVTYPVVAYTTGHEFNRGIYKSFYDYHIEDFWLPFWANTTNITWSRMEVHTTGYAWRYIRASMSLAGLLPPLCDEGDMLVDGGYIDNLPVSVMLRMGADSVFAVDVGSVDDTSPRNFPESISGWWLLISKLNPWSSAHQVPTMTDIQSRLTYVSSVKTLEEAKATPGVLYMRMPVTEFATMDFGKFEQISKKGYEASKEMLKEMDRFGRLPQVLNQYFTHHLEESRMGSRVLGQQGMRLTVRRNSI